VVKADGLAAGKGVLLCSTAEEASAAVHRCMTEGAFGPAGQTVVIEEFLTGREVSVFAFTDGVTISPLVAACDYKQVGDGDVGPNTGGMGSFTPPEFWSEDLAEEVKRTVIAPVLRHLAGRGTPYRGVIYAGLMLTEKGIQTLEFNCRFGDPEAQVILPLLESDPLEVMLACAQGTLDQAPVIWRSQAHVGVVMTSGGYPGEYQTGCRIAGLETEIASSLVFHAGTMVTGESAEGLENPVVTSGGRVLTVVGWGDNLSDARSKAYRRLEMIHFDGCYYRKDIGDITGTVENREWLPNPVPQSL
jgi:phosphoribosylamine--glycine ligase